MHKLSVWIVLAVGCGSVPSDQITQGVNDDLECQERWEPAPTPMGCDFEISMDSVMMIDGQGASEGALELQVTGSAGGGGSVFWQSEPDGVAPGVPRTIDALVATVHVPPNTLVWVEVCASVVEVDGGGGNGQSDGGSACAPMPLRCDMPTSAAFALVPICRGNDWTGATCNTAINAFASTIFTAKREDADDDGVANEDDFTPDPCDEGNMGSMGRAVLLYVYAPGNPDFPLVAKYEPDFKKATKDYDYVVLVRDQPNFDALGLDDWILKHANRIFDATTTSLHDAMQDITSRGYDMDIYIWTTGVPHGTAFDGSPTSAAISATDGEIDGPDLAASLDPALIGAHTVPIRMVYSTGAWNAFLNPTWLAVGAQAASGPAVIDFGMNVADRFMNEWNNGATYIAALTAAPTNWARGNMEIWVDGEGDDALVDAAILPPGCFLDPPNGPMHVIDLNPCALWYFEDALTGSGAAAGPFDFIETYDVLLSGSQNMGLAAARQPQGGNPTKFAGIVY